MGDPCLFGSRTYFMGKDAFELELKGRTEGRDPMWEQGI